MSYRDGQVSRVLAFCAFGIFAIGCLIEVVETSHTYSATALEHEAIRLAYVLPKLEGWFLERSSDTLRAIALVHSLAAVVLAIVFAPVAVAFARRTTLVRSLVLVGFFAFLPITSTADLMTRAFVDTVRGSGAYVVAMSPGDGTVVSSNGRGMLGSTILNVSQALYEANADGLDAGQRDDLAVQTIVEATYRVTTIVSVFRWIMDVLTLVTALTVIAWTVKCRSERLRRAVPS